MLNLRSPLKGAHDEAAARKVSFRRLYYHVIWATRDRQPLIAAEMHATLQRSLRATGQENRALVHAVGIMPDHVHVVISIPPSAAIATVVGRLKGSSSHLLNSLHPSEVSFAWQAEYGVLSFAEKDLAGVVDYANNQPARHAAGKVSTAMETIGERDQPPSGGFVG